MKICEQMNIKNIFIHDTNIGGGMQNAKGKPMKFHGKATMV